MKRRIRTPRLFSAARVSRSTRSWNCSTHGHRAEALHGGMEQRQRDRVMGRFRDGTAELPGRDRRCRTWPRHRTAVARHQLRCAGLGRDLRPPHRPHGARRPRRNRHYARRAARAPPAPAMEAATKQKIEVAPIPTVADLRARRLEITRVAARASDRRQPRPHPGRRPVARERVRHRGHCRGCGAARALGGRWRWRRSGDPGAGASTAFQRRTLGAR